MNSFIILKVVLAQTAVVSDGRILHASAPKLGKDGWLILLDVFNAVD